MKNSETKQRIWKKIAPAILALTLVLGAQIAQGKSYNVPEKSDRNTDKPGTLNISGEDNAKSDSGKVESDSNSATEMVFSEDMIEEAIEIEDWMLDASHKFWTGTEEESEEEELVIEDWMLDLSYWQ